MLSWEGNKLALEREGQYGYVLFQNKSSVFVIKNLHNCCYMYIIFKHLQRGFRLFFMWNTVLTNQCNLLGRCDCTTSRAAVTVPLKDKLTVPRNLILETRFSIFERCMTFADCRLQTADRRLQTGLTRKTLLTVTSSSTTCPAQNNINLIAKILLDLAS